MSRIESGGILGSLAMVGQLGLLMVVCILAGFLAGWYLDAVLHTRAVFTVVLLLSGIAAGMWACYKAIMRGLSKREPQDRCGSAP